MPPLDEAGARTLLTRLLEDGLQGAAADEARIQLEQFPHLARELRAHDALQRSLRALPTPSLPAGFEQRLAARLQAPPPFMERLRTQWREWLLPLSLVTAAAAAGMLLLVGPVMQEGSTTGVAGASLMAANTAAPEVTLRIRAGRAQWTQIRSGLERAGVAVTSEPAARGALWTVELPASVATVQTAARELSAISHVELQGMPSVDMPVRLRVVLTQQ